MLPEESNTAPAPRKKSKTAEAKARFKRESIQGMTEEERMLKTLELGERSRLWRKMNGVDASNNE